MADTAGLKWMEAQTQEKYNVKSSILGPEPGMKREVKILNRTLRWTQDGIEYESDPKHAELVVRECEVETGRIARFPGSKKDESREDDQALSPSEASRLRAVVASMNYVGPGGPAVCVQGPQPKNGQPDQGRLGAGSKNGPAPEVPPEGHADVQV